MRGTILTLAMLFATDVSAQDANPARAGSPGREQTDEAATALSGVPGFARQAGYAVAWDMTRQSKAAPQQPRLETRRPRIQGSMVGYVENAVVGSQIRFRFDAGWHNDFPDRAEFFYAKCGCFRGTPASPGPDPDAPGPGGAATDVNFLDFDMYAEYAPHGRFSLFAEVPVRRIEPQAFAANAGTFENAGGLSDIRAGFKVGLTATDSTAVTFQFRSYLPTGDAAKGLGTDHAAVESSALVYHQITYRTAIELQVGEWHPIGASSAAGVPGAAADEGFAGDILFFGFGPSYKLYERNDFLLAPVAELFAWRVLSGFQTGPASPSDASGTNIVNLKVGARASFGIHDSIYVGYGRALTDSKWYKDIFRVEYRYSF